MLFAFCTSAEFMPLLCSGPLDPEQLPMSSGAITFPHVALPSSALHLYNAVLMKFLLADQQELNCFQLRTCWGPHALNSPSSAKEHFSSKSLLLELCVVYGTCFSARGCVVDEVARRSSSCNGCREILLLTGIPTESRKPYEVRARFVRSVTSSFASYTSYSRGVVLCVNATYWGAATI